MGGWRRHSGELEWRLPRMRVGRLGRGREAIELLEDGQIALSGGDGLKAAEVLIVLVKAADDEFHGVVGGRDRADADAIGQLGPVAVQEIEILAASGRVWT